MRRFAWCTDIHLDCADNDAFQRLCADIAALRPEGLLLTGDISTGSEIAQHLVQLEAQLGMPIYFVAGNHDYYGTSVEQGRAVLREIANRSNFLRHMPSVSFASLTESTALVGHDGWYDCRNGDLDETDFIMNDWRLIDEFSRGWMMLPGIYHNGSSDPGRFTKHIVRTAQALAQEAADHVAAGIKAAVHAKHKNVLVLTHFPPFVQSVRGHHADPGCLPWYSNCLMGQTLSAAAAAYPKVRFTVLSGHSHARWDGDIARNLAAHVGSAKYGEPSAQVPIDVE